MASAPPPRSALATVVGWVLVAVVVWLVLTTLIGTLRWILRGVLIVGLVLGLAWLWVTLKGDPPSDPR